MHAVIPLKGFGLAKARLAPDFPPATRAALARATADHVAAACVGGGFDLVVVTGDEAVADWANERGSLVVADPGTGLDAACTAGIAASTGAWVVVHGDLPLLDRPTMERVRSALVDGIPVIAPARDGGTNLIGHTRPVAFAYGVGSFHRHLPAMGRTPLVLTGATTLIEVDTPEDVAAAATLPDGAWLERFLS